MENENKKGGSLLGGALLIAGTTVGAGMLAMPVAAGLSGLMPSLVANLICWAFMLVTGLLFLEVTLWMPDGANVLSMAHRFLGNSGRFFGGIAFLFLYYCLMVAYTAGAAPAFIHIVNHLFGVQVDGFVGMFLFALIFGAIVAVGVSVVDRINWILMTAVIGSYVLLVYGGADEVKMENIMRTNWPLSFAAFPVLFGAYGYHNVIPSIASHLKHNGRSLRWAIVLGTLFPLVVYSIWQWVIIGMMDVDQLLMATKLRVPITETLRTITGDSWLSPVAQFFGFFALITSVVGVAISMVDFLGDGLKITNRTGWRRIGLTALVFLPPIFMASGRPEIFQEAMGFAGGFGEAFLNGFLPVAMVWVGRYRMKLSSEYCLPGGKGLLVILMIITFFVAGLEFVHLFG